MSLTGRIVSIFLINLLILVWLIRKLIRVGFDYHQALRVAWDVIVSRVGCQEISRWTVRWGGIFQRSWWIIIFIYTVLWIIVPDLEHSLVLAAIILLHFYWYWSAFRRGRASIKTDRVLNIDDHWGVIYQEIVDIPEIQGKSLAELDLRKQNLLVLAVERNGQINPFPKGQEILISGDRLVVFGDLHSFQLWFGGYQG